jgi:hypothetical protein
MAEFAERDGESLFASSHQWIDVVTYRGFYDVPRVILAKTVGSGFWILESAFDDETDDFADCYRIYNAGEDEAGARACFERHLQGMVGALVGEIPVARLLFDDTQRAAFKIAEEPGNAP